MKKFLVTTVLSLTMVLGFSAFVLAADAIPDNPPDAATYTKGSEEIKGTLTTDDTKYDNKINNVNQTGKGVASETNATTFDSNFQTVQGQRTHGEYQNNTNSCASCHQTHTAAAADLLFKDGVYTTCTACHDGTLGILNVFAGSTAGTFGGTTDGNASMHMPTGAMKVNAAPGGNRASTNAETWGAEFTCASCHSPHGSFSDRLLNYNPNGVGTTPMYFTGKDVNGNVIYTEKDGTTPSATPVKTGGLQVTNVPIVDSLPNGNSNLNVPYVQDPADQEKYVPNKAQTIFPEYVVWRTTKGAAKIVLSSDPKASDPVIVLMKRGAATEKAGTDGKAGTADDVTSFAAYTRDVTPWINNHAGGTRATWTLLMGPEIDKDGNLIFRDTNDNKFTKKLDGKYYDKDGVVVTDQTKIDSLIQKQDAMAYDSKDVNLSMGYAEPNAVKSSSFPADPDLTFFKALKTATIARATVVKFDFLVKKDALGQPIDAIGNVIMDPVDTTKVIDVSKYPNDSRLVYLDQGKFNGLAVKQVDIASYSKKGFGIQISQYCAACHTDYLATAGQETGVWSKAFRHNTVSDTYTCLKCHFAHGTDVTVMLDAQDRDINDLVGTTGIADLTAAKSYMKDQNPSSALKRYTNMAVCWKCHTSSHSESFINNEWFSGDVAPTVNGSTEFTTPGSLVPAGWVDPDQTKIPYYNTGKGTN